jgi:chemotaxis protein MotB
VSYADFITLLLAFFVVLFASAQVDHRKIEQLAAGIQAAFQQLGAFPATYPPSMNVDRSAYDTMRAIEKLRKESPMLQERDEGSSDQDLTALEDELKHALENELTQHAVALHRESDGLVLSLREFGFFESGSASMRPAALPALDRIAGILALRSCRLRIEGHTDNVPIHTNSMVSNWELSTARATELVRLMILRYKISPQRLAAAGYAEYHPISSNSTPQGRAQNRRVDIVMLSQRVLVVQNSAEPAGTIR